MARSKTTKRALVASACATLMCVAMLIGTTFAWFTDTASTSVNKIQSGTLKVQLVDAQGNDLEGTTLDFKKAAEATEGEKVLWEPGCTYELPAVYVKNNGSLALKYEIKITGINGDAKLNEAIDWTINGNAIGNNIGELAAGVTSEALTIKGHMKEEAGNEYQNLSIDGIAITVYATQNTVEYDSNDNQYDKDAFDALAALYPVYASAEVTETGANISTSTVSVSVPKAAIAEGVDNVAVTVTKSADVDSTFTLSSDENTTVQQFDVEVTGIKDNNTSEIEVKMFIGKGYTFSNPSAVTVQHLKADNSVENLTGSYDTNTGFVAFKTTSFSPFAVATPNVDAVVGTGTETTYYADLANAVSAVNTDGGTVTLLRDVVLSAPITIGTTSTNNKTIAIVGNNHKLDGSGITSANCNSSDPRAVNVWDGTNMTVTLKNLTIVGPEASYGRGIATGDTNGLKLILEDCEVSASYYAINVYEDANHAYNPEITVRNTTLKNVSGYCAINIWAQGTKATFENSTLIGVNKWSGTSDDFATIVLVNDKAADNAKNSTLAFTNCTIKAVMQGTAIEYLLDARASGAKATFDGCKFFVNGTEVTGDAIQSNMKTKSDTTLTIS